MREQILQELDEKGINYCFAAWQEFTTLTHEEEKNLKRILHSLQTPKEQIKELLPVGGKCSVFCKELNRFFSSKKECAKFFKTSISNITQASKGRYKLLRKYTIQEV